MEPDIVCSMLGDIKSQGHTVKTLIGDDDATGYARARKEVFSHLEKHSDKNHLRKNITKKLYALKHVHKKSISTMIIKSLTKNFNYMLDQNRGNPDGIEKGLESVVEHMYGNHNYCSLEWCGALKNQQSHNKEHAEYKHSNLPYGRDLSDQELKADLKQIFEPLKSKIHVLANLGSSNPCESHMNTNSSKANKRIHYGGSFSFDRRLHAAIGQKNIGYSYISEVSRPLYYYEQCFDCSVLF